MPRPSGLFFEQNDRRFHFEYALVCLVAQKLDTFARKSDRIVHDT